MGHLVAGVEQHLLPDGLRHQHLEGLVGGGPARKPARAKRQQLGCGVYEAVDVEAGLGRDGHHLIPLPRLGGGGYLGVDHILAHLVDLGDDQQLAGAHGCDLAGHPLVAGAKGLAGVHQKRHHVHVFQTLKRAAVELLAQGVMRLVDARGVHQHHLQVVAVEDGAQAMAGGLGGV